MSEKQAITKFEWGQIDWIYESDYNNTANVVSVGVLTVLPGKNQGEHLHRAEEQVVCVLSGCGKLILDGKEIEKIPGSILHIGPGRMHETINTGDEELRELVVLIPSNYETPFPYRSILNTEESLDSDLLARIENSPGLAELFDHFATALGLPVAFFNPAGRAVIQGAGYPQQCSHCFECEDGEFCRRGCDLYEIRDRRIAPHYRKPTIFVCRHGLSVILCSIAYGNRLVGMIKGGHMAVFPEDFPETGELGNALQLESESNEAFETQEFYTKARVSAVLKQFDRLRREVDDYYAICIRDDEIERRKSALREVIENEQSLKRNLRLTAEKALNLRMNNHFLFNTLNVIGSLSVRENAFDTYEAIVSLSNMFRYTLQNEKHPILLKDELFNLKNYSYLQKLRLGERVRVTIKVEDGLDNVMLPPFSLQPIIENAFLHGAPASGKPIAINVVIHRVPTGILIRISDNGNGMDPDSLQIVREKIKCASAGEKPGGLAMVAEKFNMLYGDRYSFRIDSALGEGTVVEIRIDIEHMADAFRKEDAV
jgi:quercetin dioxygenase-like cupin family protein/ligand-binding sensor protein